MKRKTSPYDTKKVQIESEECREITLIIHILGQHVEIADQQKIEYVWLGHLKEVERKLLLWLLDAARGGFFDFSSFYTTAYYCLFDAIICKKNEEISELYEIVYEASPLFS